MLGKCVPWVYGVDNREENAEEGTAKSPLELARTGASVPTGSTLVCLIIKNASWTTHIIAKAYILL
ncbi:MAG: hypothetical protein WKF70_12440, partial [Chitinophagaceae bacterium]